MGKKEKGVKKRSTGGSEMTDKQKKFAALAPPRDKITYADKIAGATGKVKKARGGGYGGGGGGDEVLAARRCKGGGIAIKGTDFKVLDMSTNISSPLGIVFGGADIVNVVELGTAVTVCVPVYPLPFGELIVQHGSIPEVSATVKVVIKVTIPVVHEYDVNAVELTIQKI